MAAEAPDTSPVLICPECRSEHRSQDLLFKHLAAAHADVIMALPPKAPRKKPEEGKKKKLTWKEEAMREIAKRENRRSAKRAAPKPKAAPELPAPTAAKAAAKPAPAPAPAPARPAPPKPAAVAPAPEPESSAPQPAEAACPGHEWEPAGESQFLRFERCVHCGHRRMRPRSGPAAARAEKGAPVTSAAAARRLSERYDP